MQIEAEENEVSLLDLLLVVADNLKLLILGPLLVGLLALGISFTLLPTFTSQAIIALPTQTQTQTQPQPQPQTPAQAAAIMVSPLVLDPVIVALNLSDGQTTQIARTRLAKQVKAVAGKDGLVRLDVSATTPTQAQAIANAIIDYWLKSSVPAAQEREDLEKRLTYAKGALAAVERLLQRLTTEGGAASLGQPLTRGEAGTSIMAVGELQARYFAEVLTIPRSLQGLSREAVVKQEPTLPTERVAPKKSLIAILSALASGFALLLWVFMRQAWNSAAQDPQAAGKQARLRAAIGFKD